MDHAYIENNQVIDRYLMEKLPTAESARFEAHYLDCQRCLDQLELAETFLHEFRGAAARQAARATGLGFLAWLTRRRVYQAALLATTVLVAAGVTVSFERRLAEERQARSEVTEKLARAYRPQVETLVLPLDKERGASAEEPSRRIRLGASPEWIVFSLPLSEPRQAVGPYRVTLIDGHGNDVWRSEPFEPDTQGSLRLSLHSSWLGPGDYRLRVDAVGSSGGESGDATYFAFRVLSSS